MIEILKALNRRDLARLLLVGAVSRGQVSAQAEDRARALVNTALRRTTATPQPIAKPTEKSDPPPAVVGLTLWRLRPASASELGVRLVVHEESEDRPLVSERISFDQPLHEGSRFRMAIESARKGHLYVFSRERYNDGTVGEPYLIYPTTRILSGRNDVSPGRPIEIPAWSDSPNYFTLRKSRADQAGEDMFFLVTHDPIAAIKPTSGSQRISASDLAKWQSRWAGAAKISKAALSEPYSEAENKAAQGGRPLTASEPLPESLYLLDENEGDGLMVKVFLRTSQG